MTNPNEFLSTILQRWKSLPLWLRAVLVLSTALLAAFVLEGLTSSPARAEGQPFNATALAMDVFFKLSAVLALILVASYFLRRWKFGTGTPDHRRLAVLESLHLSPKRSLVLIRAGERILLVGSTDQSMTLLTELDPAAVNAAEQKPQESQQSFADLVSMLSAAAPAGSDPATNPETRS